MKKLVTCFSFLTIICSSILLTGCSNGGTSQKNSTAFVSGDGSALIIPVSQRKSAPAISGRDLDSNQYIFKPGKILVLNLWASWCSPCRAEAPLLADFANKNPGIDFLGILTRDEVSAAKNFVSHFKIPYPTLADSSIILSFKGQLIPNAIPTTLIIDKSGKVAARISGEVTSSLLKSILTQLSGENINA